MTGGGGVHRAEWLTERLAPEVERSLSRLERSPGVRHVAVMPDVHLASQFCVGTVIGTEAVVYPGAVGSDIGCGIVAHRLTRSAEILGLREGGGARILRALAALVPIVRHTGKLAAGELPDDLDPQGLSDGGLARRAVREGNIQLGTLGRGNHFLELARDDAGQPWVMVHSGSRGMGQAIFSHHLRRCRETSDGLAFLDADTVDGQSYLSDVAWARRYAATSRRFMVEAAAAILEEYFGTTLADDEDVACDHNHVQQEEHMGVDLWVHRKGAVSASDGEAGIVAGTMGTVSYITEGRGNTESLRSSSHGAGRVLTRGEARSRLTLRQLRRQLAGVTYDKQRERVLLEEAPAAYRDARAVMQAQGELTRIRVRLQPLLVYKG